MIYPAYELLAKLKLLALCGQNADGELEWIGNDKQWNALANEELAILMDYELTKF